MAVGVAWGAHALETDSGFVAVVGTTEKGLSWTLVVQNAKNSAKTKPGKNSVTTGVKIGGKNDAVINNVNLKKCLINDK